SLSNCIYKAKNERKRAFVSDQLKDCKDLSSVFFMLPFQKAHDCKYIFIKGYLINLDIEKQIWDYAFGNDCFKVTSTLSAFKYLHENASRQCQLVVDVGYSFTHVIPYCRGRKIVEATFRSPIGGKSLTNHLKEIISYRQLHVMEETYVINQCKEDTCFVSQDFISDLTTAKNSSTYCVDYVLPDFVTTNRGFVKESVPKDEKSDEQSVRLNNERFAVPELIFRPSDIGLSEMGLAELIVHSINQCPEVLRPHLTKNIVLTGGCCKFPGFSKRVEQDVRSSVPEEYEVEVFLPDDPIGYAWFGGKCLASSNSLSNLLVTKKEYEECGSNACQKFV
uniref:Actin-related protein 6 n=1 Tax=Romanomermis culicivorax TaxID=13658 RepID=A0A915KUA3_ROMCU